MSRSAVGAGLLGVGVVLFIIICLMIAPSVSSALGSPKQLRLVTAGEVQKIEQACPAKAKAAPAKPRKILVFWLCKGFFHECIPVANKAIETIGKKTGAFEIVTSDDMNMFDTKKLSGFDAVLFNNTTKLEFSDPNQREALLNFIKGGKGVIGIHAATDNLYNWQEGAEMMGGIFDGHPWTGEGTWAVKNAEPNHPLNAGFKGKDFKIKDEIYRTKPLNLEKNCRVLLRLDLTDQATKSANGVRESDQNMPIDWIRNYGKGRVFYCGLGHNNEIFWNPAVLEHYLDGIQFALGDFAVDAAPAAAEKAKE